MEYLDKTGLAYFWGKIKPKFYEKKIIPASGVVTPSGSISTGMTADIGASTVEFEKGLYMITYDVFLYSDEQGNSCDIFVSAETGSAQVDASTAHTLTTSNFGDMAFGTTISYTDFIELNAPSKIAIKAGNKEGTVALKLGSWDRNENDYYPTILKLR